MEHTLELLDGKYLYMIDQNRVINANIKNYFIANAEDQTLSINNVVLNEKLLKKKVKDLAMITLEVTQECNLRCKYCVYNENYENYRPFTTTRMTWQTARKGIDYIYSLVEWKKEKKFNIGFYGGEPLLNSEVIKQSVEYSKKKFTGWDLSFTLTTNLTALDLEILSFLIENNFNLSISLDGNKQNQDAKRVFVNGKGTYDTVMKKLETIKNVDNDFFQKNVSFTAVYSYDLPFENLTHFFNTNELVKDRAIRFSNVNQFKTNYFEKFPWEKKKVEMAFQQFQKNIVSKLKNQEKLTPIEDFYNSSTLFASESLKYRSFTTIAQTCLFDSRLFIDAAGEIHICERMNNAFKIGNIEKGLNFPKMLTILNAFTELIKKECKICEIRFLCTRCLASFADNEKFTIPPGFCESQKKIILNNLNKYIQYREEGLIQ